MKQKDLSELKNKTLAEVDVMVAKIKVEVVKAKLDLEMHRAKNTNFCRNLKKNLAQMLTIRKDLK